MTAASLLVASVLELVGPDGNGQMLHVNPEAIVDFRAPRRSDHFAPGARCLVFLSNGKFLSVVNSCAEIKEKLQQHDK